MNSTDNWLVHDHSMYEELLIQCREAVEVADWSKAEHVFKEYINHLRHHITMEEELLYPAYEARVGDNYRPTEALRQEHGKIGRFIRDLLQVLKSRDSGHVIECFEKFEEQMNLHHDKEEDLFLPMAGIILQDSHEELTKKLESFDATNSTKKWDF